jgi:hypothetical protein
VILDCVQFLYVAADFAANPLTEDTYLILSTVDLADTTFSVSVSQGKEIFGRAIKQTDSKISKLGRRRAFELKIIICLQLPKNLLKQTNYFLIILLP